MKIRIGVAGEGERREAGFADDDAELLLELADQGLFGALARLDLAAGKFPQARHRFAGGALGDQHAAVRVNEGAGGDQDEVCAHSIAQVISTSAVIVMVPTSTGTAILAGAPIGMSASYSLTRAWLRWGWG